MFNNKNINYLLVALGSFLVGFIYFTRKPKPVDENFNKTIAKEKGGRYFLVFNNIVVLTREVSKEQYDQFLQQYPTGKANNNVLSQFSTPPTKYTQENGKYFEYTWTGSQYSQGIEITKEEYDFLTKKNATLLVGDLNI